MNNALLSLCAVASSVVLASSTAFAFCSATKAYDNISGVVVCSAEGDDADTIVVTDQHGDVLYEVEAAGVESMAGGALLDSTGSVVSGTRVNGTFGPCNESFFPAGGTGHKIFNCRRSNRPVAFIRVFAE